MPSTAQAVAPAMGQALATALARRDQILAFEAALAQMPGAVFGDAFPLRHTFAPGLYVREITIPKGTVLTGKVHRHTHPNFLLQGEVIVFTEQGGREHLTAPMALLSPAGTKRAILALEETVWVTVHHNPDNLTDLVALEAAIIAPDYAALAAPDDRADSARALAPLDAQQEGNFP